ncbi:hypothetical protein [Aequorivita viscosa]|uniref:Uncharacterized protein n=1 Tax=Aequorivita viscosa TaxID=797419 RepID=A0A1M6MN15_9FLAO|nr:hypothetical protein [Aequorivita viscosa]SDX42947.1 hypothetical protein SAMN05216556_1309 [Aequorivita viscosa]SHJ84888.1 hypothetical protein SAMN04487908_12829 [Aequorivita viscosa]
MNSATLVGYLIFNIGFLAMRIGIDDFGDGKDEWLIGKGAGFLVPQDLKRSADGRVD